MSCMNEILRWSDSKLVNDISDSHHRWAETKKKPDIKLVNLCI